MATNERAFDLRTLERTFKRGQISREEYDKYLEALPDSSDKAETFNAEFVEGVLNEDENE